jgi:RecA-family ATPase
MAVELPSRRKKVVDQQPTTEPKKQVELPKKIAPPKQADETLPQAPEAEEALVGAMMIDPKNAIPTVVQAFRTPKYFCNKINATLYQALLDMWDSGAGVDFVTFNQYLVDRNLLTKVGGKDYVTKLFTTNIGATATVDWYIEIIRKKYLLRRMIGLGTAITRAAYASTNEEPDELLATFTGSFGHLIEDSKMESFADAAHWLNGEMPALPRVLVPYLLHQGSKMTIAGTSKSNKTWALMDLALSIATGSEWWGFKTYKSRVCYINLELQEGFFADRLKALCEHKNAYPEPGWFKILNRRGHAEPIEALRKRFTTLLKAGYFRVIFVDPVYKVLGQRNENDAGDIATLLNELEAIAVDTDAAIIFAAHYSKGQQWMKESIDRISGSGVFARDADTTLTMTVHEESDCFSIDTTLRNLAPTKSFVVRWNYPMFVRDDEQDPQKLKGRPPMHDEKEILDVMSVVNGKTKTAIKQESGLSTATFYRFWAKLQKTEKIRMEVDTDQHGIWFRSHKSVNTSENIENNEKTEVAPEPVPPTSENENIFENTL